MTLSLPTAIKAYFAAANTADADAVAAAFADDALVHDEGHDIRGRDAIRAWAAEARAKYNFQAQPSAIESLADATVVTAHVAGDFPGNPVDLRYRFKLTDGLIAALEIAPA
jgi:uncharacterized protein (TIGR02246 family)